MNKIPFFNYPLLYKEREKIYKEAIEGVLSRGAYIMQEELLNFENDIARYLSVKHAIGVGDGTMAILCSLIASGVGKGDEVIVPAHTFIASVAAIHHVGAEPILVDCGKDHLIDAESVKKVINEKSKAIMPVQLNGRVANMDPILEIARKNNLLIIEDSCQAFGASYKGNYAGTFGEAGTFSFFPAKTLGCFGDGGAVITNSDEVAEKINLIRDHGRDPRDGKVKLFGFNSRLDNLQAAVLSVKLKKYNEDISRRREIASIYNEDLKEIEEIFLPPPPSNNSDHFDIFQNYEIEVEKRDELRKYLSSRGIATILPWGGFTVNNFEELGFSVQLPNTDRMAKKFMLLPLHTMLKDEEVSYITKEIINFYN